MRIATLAALAATFISTIALGQDEKVELKQKYPPGAYVMTMTTEMKQDMRMDAAAESVKQTVTMLMVMELVADEPTGTGQTLHVTYRRIKMGVQGAMPISYDSAAPKGQQNQMLAPIYESLIGAQIDITLNPDGKVVSASGVEKMLEKMAAGNPAVAPMLSQIKGQLGDEMLRQQFSQMESMLPTKPVGTGDTWEADMSQAFAMIGQVKAKQVFTLKDIRKTPAGRVAAIDFTGRLTKAEDQAATAPATNPALPFKFDELKMDLAGTINMNVDTGMMTDMTAEQKVSMEMAVPAGPDGQETKMSIEQKGTTRCVVTPGKYTPPVPAPAASQPAAEKL